MTLAEDFRTAFNDSYNKALAAPELVPMVLAKACVAVLPVAGAGLSLTDALRVPLGASSADAAAVERLQTTLGEGPCLHATAEDEPFLADLATIADRWPMFHRQLVDQTPYRSVVSFPLRSQHQIRFGALDLYLTTDEVPEELSIPEVASNVAKPMAHVVFDLPAHSSSGLTVPPWLNISPATDRMSVWIAVGMLIEHFNLTNTDALAALRGYSFSHDITLDATANQLTTAKILPAAILG